MEEELVSCLTVTRNRPLLLQRSIRMFLDQTYSNKEMVIVYYSNDEETIKLTDNYKNNKNIHFYEYNNDLDLTLGDIRNISISKARGKYVCCWDDDDVYHPNRLRFQIEYLIKNKKYACTLKREGKWNITTKELGLSGYNTFGWENSIVCLRDKMPDYASLNSGEDTVMLSKLRNNVCVLDIPYLYIYTFHGTNTVSEDHFEMIGYTKIKKEDKKIILNLLTLYSSVEIINNILNR